MGSSRSIVTSSFAGSGFQKRIRPCEIEEKRRLSMQVRQLEGEPWRVNVPCSLGDGTLERREDACGERMAALAVHAAGGLAFRRSLQQGSHVPSLLPGFGKVHLAQGEHGIPERKHSPPTRSGAMLAKHFANTSAQPLLLPVQASG